MVLRMPSPTRLKSGVYYYIVRVPSDLVAAIGKPVLKESLRTKDHGEAKILFAERHNKSLQEWQSLRSGPTRLTHKQTVALAGERYQFWLDEFSDDPGPATELKKLLEMKQGVERDEKRLTTWYSAVVEKLVRDEGLRLDEGTRFALMRQIHETDIQVITQLINYADGDYSADPKADRFPSWSDVKPRSNSVRDPSNETSFESLFGLWQRDHLASGGAERTIADFQHKITSLKDYLKHQDAPKVVPRDVSDWCDHLRHKEGLKAKTVRDKYLAAAKAIFRVGVHKHRIEKDPTRGIVVRVEKPKRNRSKGFTQEEAVTILTCALRDPDELGRVAPGNKKAIRWSPWICAFSGARGGEITQLRKEDLILLNDIPCLRITPEAGSVKSGAYRVVPVHPQLIELGLIEFINQSRGGYLFFELRGPDDDPKKRAASVYKKVGQWVRETAGITDRSLQPNHAWRHRFKTLCRDHDVGEEYSDAITGHEDGRAASDYGEMTARALHREICKLPWYDVGRAKPAP